MPKRNSTFVTYRHHNTVTRDYCVGKMLSAHVRTHTHTHTVALRGPETDPRLISRWSTDESLQP